MTKITKSYKIHKADGWIQVSETQDKTAVSIQISGGPKLLLDMGEWKELCGLQYDLDVQAEQIDYDQFETPAEVTDDDRTEEA